MKSLATDDLADEKTLCEDDIVSSSGIKTPETELTSQSEDDHLALRPKLSESTSDLSLRLHPLPEGDGLIVSVTPPRGVARVPCDVVLIIDVSGSMGAKAPAPDNAKGETEVDGLTVLDLTKQAARAIVETMDDNDRLGIVTFTDDATIVMELTPMTKANKSEAWGKIKTIRPLGLTNMWHGILEGKSLLDGKSRPGCMPAMMVLTDGISNCGNPPQGFVNRLRTYDLPAPIHTFGFGFDINSSLLQSVAEVANGNFAFISDASMLATVFIHAMAHLQSTFASTAKLVISSLSGLSLVESMGPYIRKEELPTIDEQENMGGPLSISLGALQFAQSRDILLKWADTRRSEKKTEVHVELHCQPLDGPAIRLETSCSPEDASSLSHEKMLFHRNRAAICSFITTFAPIGRDSERKKETSGKSKSLQPLIDSIKRLEAIDGANLALLEDISDQISLAVSDQYIDTWGFHYLLSMYNAHFKQLCTSFKDPGPQQYNKDSPVFQDAKNKLSDLFDTLPPPKPSVTVREASGHTRSVAMSMRRYNRSSNPCFAASCQVRLADESTIAISQLRPGAKLRTPAGVRTLVAVVETKVEQEVMCCIGELLVTPWHPIRINGTWVFPANVAGLCDRYTGSIYSLMLEPDECCDAHSVEIGGYVGVTLGHGILDHEDVRKHPFFGDYGKVWENLQRLKWSNGVFQSGGTRKDSQSGLVCGFLPEVGMASAQKAPPRTAGVLCN
jgi:Hint-domain/VWA / Hh  protein intein-like/von Willebrand factor type A domain